MCVCVCFACDVIFILYRYCMIYSAQTNVKKIPYFLLRWIAWIILTIYVRYAYYRVNTNRTQYKSLYTMCLYVLTFVPYFLWNPMDILLARIVHSISICIGQRMENTIPKNYISIREYRRKLIFLAIENN